MTEQTIRNEQYPIPPEIDRWNWGAFLLNWIWGIGNQTFIALLVFIPFFGILIMPFVLGAKGSKWAWRNGRWDNIAHFKRVQRLWAIWGVIIWAGMIVLYAGLFGSIFYALKHSEAYELGAAKLHASLEATDVLGTPISTGYPSGAISVDGKGEGKADFNFSATGPKASGSVVLEAVEKNGVWSLKILTLKVDGREAVIDLLKETRADSSGARLSVNYAANFE